MIKYNLIRWSVLSGILFSLLLVTPLTNASDIFYFSFNGYIKALERNAIRLDDGFYTYSSTVKVVKENGVKGFTSDLKVGDYVQLTIQVMDKKKRVDSILYLPDPKAGAK